MNVDREIFETINRRTDKTWPTTWFAPRLTGKGAFRDVYSVMNSWGANHGAISYGHIGADLVTLASCSAFRSACTTSTRPDCSARVHGPRSAWTRKGPITAPVKITDRSTGDQTPSDYETTDKLYDCRVLCWPLPGCRPAEKEYEMGSYG